VRLAPGETALLTLDRSDEPASASEPVAPEVVRELADWTVAVESWNAGEPEVVTEDRGLGYQTREVRPTTAVSRLEAGTRSLAPWKDIVEVGPEVSGVGEYTATVPLDHVVEEGYRYLLDLGSTCGGLGSLRVNAAGVRGFDTSNPVVDVTADLRPGDNSVTVRVASSLNNRLLARGYYDKVPDVIHELMGTSAEMQTTDVHSHGLLWPVRLLRQARS
jgi:hypothetical protein